MSNQLSHDDRQRTVSIVRNKFGRYVKAIHPWPFEPLPLYRASYDFKGWIAIRYLSKFFPDTMNVSNTFTVMLDTRFNDSTHNRDRLYVSFDMIKLPARVVELGQLEAETRERMIEWGERAIHLDKLVAWTTVRLNALFGNPNIRRMKDIDPGCNTPGQVSRVWPEILPFLPGDSKDVLRNASIKSRPPSMFKWDGRRMSAEQFMLLDWDANKQQKKILEEVNQHLIAVSLIDTIDVPEGYPSISPA